MHVRALIAPAHCGGASWRSGREGRDSARTARHGSEDHQVIVRQESGLLKEMPSCHVGYRRKLGGAVYLVKLADAELI